MGYAKELDEYTDEELAAEMQRRAEHAMEGRCSYCTRSGVEPPCRYPQIHNAAVHPIVALVGYEKEIVARSRFDHLCDEERAALGALGLTGEAGEVADIIKKHIFHGALLDREKLVKELGDVLWYDAITARYTAGVSLGEVALENMRKLRLRHPNGFTKETAQAKADEEQTSPTPCGKNGCNGVVRFVENDQGDHFYRCEKCARRWAHDGPDA